tara:strand:- start:5331 stop:6233 length:903 start_codon:yes stop_codon:yes gene_type:complete
MGRRNIFKKMKVILTHIGKLPPYFEYSLKQLRIFNPHVNVIFIGDDNKKDLFNKYNIKFVYENIFEDDKYHNIIKLDKNKNIFHGHPNKSFWIFAYVRFYLIETYLKKYNDVSDFFFFENDILIYEKLDLIKEFLDNKNGDLFFTIGDDKRITTGFSYIKSKDLFLKLINDMDKILFSEEGIKDIRKNYSKCCPSEMTIMRKVKNKFNYITELPLLPSENKNFIFDPASYGQFLGGDLQGKKNHIDKITYIGKEILNKNINVTFEVDTDGYKKPFCIYKGNKYKICNLHVWAKNLKQFVS